MTVGVAHRLPPGTGVLVIVGVGVLVRVAVDVGVGVGVFVTTGVFVGVLVITGVLVGVQVAAWLGTGRKACRLLLLSLFSAITFVESATAVEFPKSILKSTVV